jgi:iron(III) transport system substrate-binding protein
MPGRRGILQILACAAFVAAAPSKPVLAADQALIAAAQKEGEVTWYTTLIIDQVSRPVADAFQKKYGIKVNYIRADGPEIYLRLFNEAHAGRVQADLFDGTNGATSLKAQNMVARFMPDSAKSWPKDYLDPEGYWTAVTLFVMTPSYNTNLVAPGTEPKTYSDLLDPRWQDKMAWNSEATATGAMGFIGMSLAIMGEDKGMNFLTRLAGQRIASIQGGVRHTLDQVIAGEYAIALHGATHNAYISAQMGAPVAWIPFDPAMVLFLVMNLTQGSPHPNAGKLLADFIASDEGQTIIRDAGYVPADPAVPPADPSMRPDGTRFHGRYFTPQETDAALPKWIDIFARLFR